jgi:glycosyltransferase involved in cell wall biosynthesis
MRVLLVCAFLSEQGGLENEAQARAEVALGAGYELSICTPHIVLAEATVYRALRERCRFDSAQQAWREGWPGRAFYAAARWKHRLTRHSAPKLREDLQLARSRMSSEYLESFWNGRGRPLLERADLIHLLGKPKPFVVAAAQAAKAIGKPVVYEEVAQITREYASRADHRGFVGASNLCDAVIVRSEAHCDDLRRWFAYTGKAHVVEQWAYEGEELLLELPVSRSKGSEESVVFGSLSRLSGEKGLGTTLSAFAQAFASNPKIRLKIAGQGALEAELRNTCRKLGMEQYVEFLGYVPDRVAFYRDIDVFIIASQEEGGPITGVEAMAARLPIITTPVGAMPARLSNGDQALFFHVDAVDELSSAILRAAQNAPLRAALGEAARIRYRARNHSEVCLPRLLDLWNSLHDQRRRTSDDLSLESACV